MYTEPKYRAGSFTCPHCGVLTGQSWASQQTWRSGWGSLSYAWATCQSTACQKPTLWLGELHEDRGFGSEQVAEAMNAPEEVWTLVWPPTRGGPAASTDMPTDVQQYYEEARSLLRYSPRAAGALLRLALQVLMPHLDQKGKNLDHDIAALVADGLPRRIQQALDSVRVIGNDSVHPGQIDTDDATAVEQLFGLINLIVRDRITEPREIEGIFEMLPDEKRRHIDERDNRSDG